MGVDAELATLLKSVELDGIPAGESLLEPRAWEVPHDRWRPGQLESVLWSLSAPSENCLLEAPTGSGKTGIARAASTFQKVVALVRSKNLQNQYADLYGFDQVMGKANYDCNDPDTWSRLGYASSEHTTDECPFTPMRECEIFEECEYVRAKMVAMASERAVLNYAYWLSVYTRWPRADIIFMDECHELPRLVLDHVGCKWNETHRQRWGLPEFPKIAWAGSSRKYDRVVGKTVPPREKMGVAIKWLKSARSALDSYKASKKKDAKRSDKARKEYKAAEIAHRNMTTTLLAMERSRESEPESWYVRSGPGVGYAYRKPVPGIVLRPLSARQHFSGLFSLAASRVMMSATVGRADVLSEELGLEDFAFRSVPGNWAPDTRPVYVLPNIPRLNYKSGEAHHRMQAIAISEAIKHMPPDWSGLIHVASKKHARSLSNQLRRLGLAGRVWCPLDEQESGGLAQYVPTNEQVARWNRRRDSVPGSLAVTWFLWSGYDGISEKINVIAKVPYGNLADEFERERMELNRKLYALEAAWTLQQGNGRNRRNKHDYDDPVAGEVNGLNLIADANWSRVKPYLSADFRAAVRSW